MTPAPAAPAAPRKVESRDPATGEVWRSYATANASAVRAAIDAARAAQSIWGAESLRHRAQAVERFRRLLFERRAEVAGVVMRENGKPAAEALTTEVMVTTPTSRASSRGARPTCSPTGTSHRSTSQCGGSASQCGTNHSAWWA